MKPAVIVNGLSKQYLLGSEIIAGQNFREMLAGMLSAPFRKFKRLRGKDETQEAFWAVQDINLEIQPGEVVGIIGRNGAGKSTLFKLLSRITTPTKGSITYRGRMASLLEVGTGFHPELTGRENIYLNGAIMGLSRREITARLQAIVAFAEIDQFLDTPVKRYSSGMYVRLAFSVAAHLDADILLVDEVLAVGDFAFQQKCLGKMKEVASEGRTVLFISHNMAAVSRLCTRGIWIDKGSIRMDSDIQSVLNHYESEFLENDLADYSASASEGAVRLQSVSVLDASSGEAGSVQIGNSCRVVVRGSARQPVNNINLALGLYDEQGHRLCLLDSEHSGHHLECRGGDFEYVCELDMLNLTAGRYKINIAIKDGRELVLAVERVTAFYVVDPLAAPHRMNEFGPVLINYRWSGPKA
ncbi:MAG: ABC transporter ATP-binding protein [Gammaproteobacteria bacterium]|nr:ABC transporter ATP-binding protein [Gammaproteobacteria bacterium]